MNSIVSATRPNKSKTAIAQEKMMQGTYNTQGEIRDWTYYDTQRINSTTLSHSFFTDGIGSPFSDGSANKTFADTNIITKGMPNAQNFNIKAIKVIYKPDEVRVETEMVAIFDLLAETTFSFKIANKDNTLELNMLDLMGINFGVTQAAAVLGQSPVRSIVSKAYPLNISIPVSALTTYRANVQHHAAPAAGIVGDKIQISLQGFLQSLS